jgi:DUF1365 family protein
VRHRRFAPVTHEFCYRVRYAGLDLSELDAAFATSLLWSNGRRNLMWLRRDDVLPAPGRTLDEAVRDLVQARTGARPAGPVTLVTQLRQWGTGFNPVSFLFVHEPGGGALQAVVAEITNTPWGERHAVVLPATEARREGPALRWVRRKDFHVSPFLPMELDWDWRFELSPQRLVVHMEDHARPESLLDGRGPWGARPARAFDATLVAERRELSAAEVRRSLLRFPFQAARVVLAIHWQALRLRLKGAPFFEHPARRATRAPDHRPLGPLGTPR